MNVLRWWYDLPLHNNDYNEIKHNSRNYTQYKKKMKEITDIEILLF